MIRVLVSGAGGKMGREVVRAVSADSEMAVCGAVDPGFVAQPIGALAGVAGLDLAVQSTLAEAAGTAAPDVIIDFTAPSAVKSNVLQGLALGVPVVWGTTGLGPDDLHEIDQAARSRGVGAFHAPNFAIGAVLMMIVAQKIARHMPAVEIIEMHGEAKRDAPSGTALRTAELIRDAVEMPPRPATEKFLVEGARGGAVGPIHIHSVRLPGYVAHQEVIFGSLAQTLTVRHDSMGRESFMPGVLLAAKRVRSLNGLTVGLESLLELD